MNSRQNASVASIADSSHCNKIDTKHFASVIGSLLQCLRSTSVSLALKVTLLFVAVDLPTLRQRIQSILHREGGTYLTQSAEPEQ